MPIFMLKCETCNSERQSPKLNTITCPDCGGERDFVKVEPDLDHSQGRQALTQATTPDLETLRKKYLGGDRTAEALRRRASILTDNRNGSDVVVRVKKPGALHPLVVIIDGTTGQIVGEQG